MIYTIELKTLARNVWSVGKKSTIFLLGLTRKLNANYFWACLLGMRNNSH